MRGGLNGWCEMDVGLVCGGGAVEAERGSFALADCEYYATLCL